VSCPNIVQFVVDFDGLVGIFCDGSWFHWEHCQLSLCSFGKSCIEFVDVGRVIIVKIGNNVLKFGPVQRRRAGALFDLVELDFGDFLRLNFSERPVDRCFKFFPCLETALAVRD